MRGVAILLVMLYHVFTGRVSGGVDIFLMISAFLMTRSFVRTIERGEKTKPVRYWAKTFERLLPPAAVTILLVLVTTRVFLPRYHWREVIADAQASIL